MSRRPGKCIFCGRVGGITKEHLFSDWLTTPFPRSAADTHTLGVVEWRPNPSVTTERRQGHSGSRKIRKVCNVCNNGWISRVDNAARDALMPILVGDTIADLTVPTQNVIATWLCKMAMVGDLRDPSHSLVVQSDRDWIRTKSEPPVAWRVWMASYSGETWRDLALFQQMGRLDMTSVGGLAGYVQSTAIGIGTVFALVLGTEVAGLELDTHGLLHQIWPARDDLAWPTIPTITDQQANSVAYVLSQAKAKEDSRQSPTT
jgi:hypothetical protein